MKKPVPSITRISSILVIVISLVVAVCVPVGYFLVAYENMQGGVNAELAFSARTVEELVVRNPKTWQFEELRLREILENRLDYDIGESRAVKDLRGQVIARTEESLTGPLVTFRAPVHEAGTVVANVEITRSINHLVVQTVIVGVSSIMMGILIFLLFQRFPLRTVRKAYRDLEENEQRLALALESGSFGVWDWDIRKHTVTSNDRMFEMFGVSRDSCVTRDGWLNRVHPEDRDRALRDYIPRTIGGKGFHTEYRIVRSDEAIRHIQANGIVLLDDEGEPARLIILNRDITERKRAEEEQIRIHKLESIGTLAGGIAHDFNNLLAVVQGYLELLMTDAPEGGTSHARISAARNAVNQAMELTGLLITFSKGGEPFKEIIEIADLVKNTVLRSVEEWPVETEFFMDADLWALEADERQLSQVVRNLAINAVEAMPEGGSLKVRIENIRVAAADGLPVPEGPYVRISMEDTGKGIPKDELPLIFDPYYSTKQRGAEKGMGLGLSVCHSVVGRHNGCMIVESQEGKGTMVRVYLPAGVHLSAPGP